MRSCWGALVMLLAAAAHAQDAPRIDELLRCDPERALRLPLQGCQRNPAADARELAAAWADWQARNQAAADAVRLGCRQQWLQRGRARGQTDADALAPYERAYRSLDQLMATAPPPEPAQCAAMVRSLREDVVPSPQPAASGTR
ncbi:hypothetical protein [Inhella proteolytica]|uniref:Lysozyme inhibitor LprI N-terminal domain-containing protein n=1 Tax=Inhella proteolytica TaxID=2795029 RepID=A0A931NHS0_9BURK|nr:hypothetical protein [Inhella proteolytica]MBH9578073.1 hypothetical protein [Inhella proteolytica]